MEKNNKVTLKKRKKVNPDNSKSTPRDLMNTHPNLYPYVITEIKHGYRCLFLN